jgi:hypothetical protein
VLLLISEVKEMRNYLKFTRNKFNPLKNEGISKSDITHPKVEGFHK